MFRNCIWYDDDFATIHPKQSMVNQCKSPCDPTPPNSRTCSKCTECKLISRRQDDVWSILDACGCHADDGDDEIAYFSVH